MSWLRIFRLNEIKTEQVNEMLIVVDWLEISFRNILCQNCIEFHLLIVSNWPYSVCVVLTTNPNILAFGSCYAQSNTRSNILRQQITDGYRNREAESGREQKRKKAPAVKHFEKNISIKWRAFDRPKTDFFLNFNFRFVCQCVTIMLCRLLP